MINIFGNTFQKIFFSFKRVVNNIVTRTDRIDRCKNWYILEGRKIQKNRLNNFLHQLFFIAFILMLCLLAVVVAGIFF